MKESIIYGRHPVTDAIDSGKTIDRLYIQKGIQEDYEHHIRNLCSKHKIDFQYVPKEKLNRLTKFKNHQGVVAQVAPIAYADLLVLVESWKEQAKPPVVLILDGVTDVRNFGAIARSAAANGVDAIITSAKNGARVNADAIKVSAGALTKIPVCREGSLGNAVALLKENGFTLMTSDLKAETYLFEMDLSRPIAIVLGSEGKGVSSGMSRRADERFIIPQKGTMDSLNVSVAAGVILYEVTRQRLLR